MALNGQSACVVVVHTAQWDHLRFYTTCVQVSEQRRGRKLVSNDHSTLVAHRSCPLNSPFFHSLKATGDPSIVQQYNTAAFYII